MRSETSQLLLVDSSVLPEVFARVVDAKRFLACGEAATAADAARKAGLSRSAFYKYRDAVFPYDAARTGRILTVHLVLRDRPGVLSSLLSAFADAGANILTVNQNIPAGGAAAVSISASTDRLRVPTEEFLRALKALPGVDRIARLGDRAGTSEEVAASPTIGNSGVVGSSGVAGEGSFPASAEAVDGSGTANRTGGG